MRSTPVKSPDSWFEFGSPRCELFGGSSVIGIRVPVWMLKRVCKFKVLAWESLVGNWGIL